MFPFLFTATVGRCAKLEAFRRLEKGATIGSLNELVGSATLLGAISTQIKQRSLGATGIVMLLLWAFSPLGSQGSVRCYYWTEVMKEIEKDIVYLTFNTSAVENNRGDSDILLSNNLFVSMLVQSDKDQRSPSDPFGNVKIPDLENVMAQGNQDVEGWWVVDGKKLTDLSYSSLLGVPVLDQEGASPVASDKSTTFRLETSYWTLSCSEEDIHLANGLFEHGGDGFYSMNAPKSTIRGYTDRKTMTDEHPDVGSDWGDNPRFVAFSVDYQSSVSLNLTVGCRIQTTYV
jgi:hypothetical protein